MYYNRSNQNAFPKALGGIIEDVFQHGWGGVFADEARKFTPPVNITETDKNYELKVIAPGLNKEDLKVSIEKNMLTISFEHKEENKEQTGKTLRNEYSFKSFKRSFTLNDKVNASGIQAKYADGVLSLTLPKKEDAEPASQEITIG